VRVLYGYARFARVRDESSPRGFAQQAVFALLPLPLHALGLALAADAATALWGLLPCAPRSQSDAQL